MSGRKDRTRLVVWLAALGLVQQLDQWPCKNVPGTDQDFKPE